MKNYQKKLEIIEEIYEKQCEDFKSEMISRLVDFFVKSGCDFLEFELGCTKIRLCINKNTEDEILYSMNPFRIFHFENYYSLDCEDINFIIEIMDYLTDNNLLEICEN